MLAMLPILALSALSLVPAPVGAQRLARGLASLLAPSLAAPSYAHANQSAASSPGGCAAECALAVRVYDNCLRCVTNCTLCHAPCRDEDAWAALVDCHACFWNPASWAPSGDSADAGAAETAAYFDRVARFCSGRRRAGTHIRDGSAGALVQAVLGGGADPRGADARRAVDARRGVDAAPLRLHRAPASAAAMARTHARAAQPPATPQQQLRSIHSNACGATLLTTSLVAVLVPTAMLVLSLFF